MLVWGTRFFDVFLISCANPLGDLRVQMKNVSSGPNVPMVNYEQASVRVPVFVGSRAWE